MQSDSARDQFLKELRQAVEQDTFIKLTLAKPAASGDECRNLFVRPIVLKTGPQLSLLWRMERRDVTKNFPPQEAMEQVTCLIGSRFLDAHLFAGERCFELRCLPEGSSKLIARQASPEGPKRNDSHDRAKTHLIKQDDAWLRALGITNDRGEPKAEMSAKYRQIQKYAELLRHLLVEAGLWNAEQSQAPALHVVDMGCGKGYLTFAVAALLGAQARVVGVELRPELVAKINEIAQREQLPQLSFVAGNIATAPLDKPDVVIALHACDTATDSALARGIAAQAKLLVVAPCCQKELRPQLTAPDILADALRHGIFQERQSEFVTDALRAELLEWAGYDTKVFEFVSTEHTPKNLMIAAIRRRGAGDETRARRIRALAAFYGIRHQTLATLLGFSFEAAPERG